MEIKADHEMVEEIGLAAELSARLRRETHPTHERLDQSIMAARPFESLESYGRFLKVQHGIHRDVAPLYEQEELAGIFPGLAARCRLGAVTHDLADLGQEPPEYGGAPATSAPEDARLPEALGWLYVIEGSNLGAAFLLKHARNMGLSETHGARHLAEPPEGRAPYWKSFKSSLDGVRLSAEEEARAVAAANAAFARVQALVQQHLC